MFRRWLSAFFKNNKEKIVKVLKVFIPIILVGIAIISVFPKSESQTNKSNSTNTLYTPTETVISGSDISEKEFEKEDDLVRSFVDFCNEGNVEEAYNLLTNECKEKLYPTIEKFKTNYYSKIFNEQKEYNLQSWISTGDYNTYRVRYLSDLLATGNYQEAEKTDDYITIVTSGNEKKLNINGYIKTAKLNKTTKTDEIEAEVTSVDIYMDYVIYYMKIENLTDKEILLDSLQNIYTLKLIGTNEAAYKVDATNLKSIDLKIVSGGEKDIKLKFIKQYGSDIEGRKIEFSKAILDYKEFSKDKSNYKDFVEIYIDL